MVLSMLYPPRYRRGPVVLRETLRGSTSSKKSRGDINILTRQRWRNASWFKPRKSTYTPGQCDSSSSRWNSAGKFTPRKDISQALVDLSSLGIGRRNPTNRGEAAKILLITATVVAPIVLSDQVLAYRALSLQSTNSSQSMEFASHPNSIWHCFCLSGGVCWADHWICQIHRLNAFMSYQALSTSKLTLINSESAPLHQWALHLLWPHKLLLCFSLFLLPTSINTFSLGW